jgi:ribosomal protein S18 acetylase RimI-like enzyme
VICTDWRDAPAEDIAPLYAAERSRWLADLSWDPEDLFAVVEQGRRAGHVAGWLARDPARGIAGWTFYGLHDSVLQIGGLVGARPSVVRRLLDAILESAEASVARGLSCFVFPNVGGTASALERQRFAVRESLYLTRTLGADDAADFGAGTDLVREWSRADFAGTVRVLAAAYAGVPGAACFAPGGTREQWAHYAWQIVRTPGCGQFDPSLSRVVCAPGSVIPAAVALVTRIAPAAVHIAQIAVAPDLQRRGRAGELLTAVLQSAALRGAGAATLMVDADNAPALRLYERFGFEVRSRMLFGTRAARTRVAA